MVELSFIENIQNVCRLCLRSEEDMIDIFQSTDNKIPLIERIFLFYQVKIALEDGLPVKICKDCFNFTETFTSYHTSVQKCEAKLQALICTAGALGTKIQHNHTDMQLSGPNELKVCEKSKSNYTEILPDDDCEVVVVDPNQDYESSDESFSESEFTPPPSRGRGTPQDSTAVNSEAVRPVTSQRENLNNITNSNSNDHEGEVADVELENRNAFLCQYCDMAFVGSNECAEHERLHDHSFPHTCIFCAFRCPERQILINHVKESHSDKPYVCVVCRKGFGRRSDLKKHAIVHTGIRPFTCSVCGKSFSRNSNLTKHMHIHSGLKPYVCQKCPWSFTTTSNLEKHQKIHNPIERPFKCPKCNASFNRKDKMQAHVKVHLKKEAIDAVNMRMNENDPGLFNDMSRTFPFSNYSNEANITGSGDGGIVHKNGNNLTSDNMVINLDQYVGRNNVNSNSTLNSNNGIGSNYDNRYNEYFQQQQQQMQQYLHQKMQLQQNKPFSMSSNIFQHTNGQQNVLEAQKQQKSGIGNMMMPPPPPFQSAGINTASQEQQSDKQNRPGNHVCSVCSKVFTRKRELQRHSVIHSGQKPFACSFCGKRFNRKDKLLRHEKIHRDGKFPCPKCKLDFAKQETLDIHLELHEKVERASRPQPPVVPEEQTQPKAPNFLQSLQVGVTPQLNFYSDTI